MKTKLEKHMALSPSQRSSHSRPSSLESRDAAPRWTPLPRVLPCEIDVLFVLARWDRVMIAYFRGEVTACQTSKNEVEASAACEKQAPAHVRELHLSFLFLTALPTFPPSTTTLLNCTHHTPAYSHSYHQPHRTNFNMRFSLATLATVALATQTATADWLSGKGGKSSIKV